MFKYQFLFIIFLILLYIVFHPKKEYYDGKIKNIDIEKCGRFCTNLYGCDGFAYDRNKKLCYLSRNPIDKHNCTSPYIDEYDESQVKCNKISSIPEYYSGILTERKRINMIYTCKNYDTDIEVAKKIVNDKIENIDLKEISIIPYEHYIMQDTIWPLNKEDFVLRDPLVHANEDYIKLD